MQGITTIDIILLSNPADPASHTVTSRCIQTLLASEDPAKICFRVFVVVSGPKGPEALFPPARTLYPETAFNYNLYRNAGIRAGEAKYVCLCHNDLLFQPAWASHLLEAFSRFADLSSASPRCPEHHSRLGFQPGGGIYNGYRNRFEVCGWCLFFKRDLLRLTGPLDENYSFWCADQDYGRTLEALRLRHALVSAASVVHAEQAAPGQDRKALTAGEFFYYEKKWNSRTLIR